MDIINVSAYKFMKIEKLDDLREEIREKGQALALRGTILLSEEGINCFFAGAPESTTAFKDFLSNTLEFGELPFKDSPSNYQPFRRFLVRLKKEIISMGQPQIKPHEAPAPSISAETLKQWYDEERDFILLDTRNDYEIRIGAFKNAMHLDIRTFRAFPDAISNLSDDFKDKTIVTVCTGGIRCEKAAPYMLSLGFKDVYQLDGGILRYFEICGQAHWEKECFVFDQRVALKPDLKETDTAQCFSCRMPLTPIEQQSPKYTLGESCPYCA